MPSTDACFFPHTEAINTVGYNLMFSNYWYTCMLRAFELCGILLVLFLVAAGQQVTIGKAG